MSAVAVTVGVGALALSALAGRFLDAPGFEAVAALAALLVGLGAGLLVLMMTTDPFKRYSGGVGITSLPMLGIAVVAIVQVVDVLAARLGARHTASFSAASTMSRVVVLALVPSVAWALTRLGRVRRGRLAVSAFVAAVAMVSIELAPDRLLSLTYGQRFGMDLRSLRVLSLAMFLSAVSLLLAGTLAASGRLTWVWSSLALGITGIVLVTALGGTVGNNPFPTLLLQLLVFTALLVHALRLRSPNTGSGVLILNWRDTANPEGGGSEVFVEEVAVGMALRDTRVTIFCAQYPGAAREETRDGVRFVRRGSRRTVYLWAFIYHALGWFGPHDVVVDVQNGVPFFAKLYCHRPVIMLVHHVCREQWDMVFRPRSARVGWWLESRVAPRACRGARYITVSQSTRTELVGLGVAPDAIEVVRSGTIMPDGPEAPKASTPTICVLSRLVAHKRVDWVIEAAAAIRKEIPDLKVVLMGRGHLEGHLRSKASELGLDETVEFMGWVDEQTKGEVLSRSWVLAMPSAREGWGLAVMEAAARQTPAVAVKAAGGVTESIVHGKTGLIANDRDGFREALRTLLTEQKLRRRLGQSAKERATDYRWSVTARDFHSLVGAAIALDAERLRGLIWKATPVGG